MKKVFVSYRRSDQTQVEAMIEDLKSSHKVEVWYDANIPGGQSWWDEILKQIRWSDVVIVALSAKMLESIPCALEQAYANELGKTLLPVQIDPEVRPGNLPEPLNERQVVPYYGQKREYDRLLKSVLDAPSAVLPNPLPEPPKIPLGDLPAIRKLLREPSLSYEDQWLICNGLRRNLIEHSDNSAEILSLLLKLRDRPELAAHIQNEVTGLITSAQTQPAEQSAALSTPGSRYLIAAVIVVLVVLIAIVTLAARPPAATATPTPETLASATMAATVNPTSTSAAQNANQTMAAPTAQGTVSAVGASSTMQLALIYEGMDAFTIVAHGAVDLKSLELKSSLASAFPETDFPAVSEAAASLATGVCLRYVRANATPPLPLDCNSLPVFSMALADANRFWWNANTNRLLDLVVKRGADVLRICPASAVRCAVL